MTRETDFQENADLNQPWLECGMKISVHLYKEFDPIVGMYYSMNVCSGKTSSVLHLLSNMQETLILFLDVMFCK